MSFHTDPDTRLSLILRIQDGADDEAWEEFVEIYQPLVQRIVQRRNLQYADAVEVTQEVLSRVAQSIRQWNPDHQKSTFRGWLYRITRNLTIDFLRQASRDRLRAGDGTSLSDVAEPSESESMEFRAEYERQLFHWAAERLKPRIKTRNWDAFWMSTVEGLPIEQVAQRLGIECGTIYVARSRIMSRLSQLIQQRLSETNDS